MAMALAVTIGSRWATRRMPVPRRSVVGGGGGGAEGDERVEARLYFSSMRRGRGSTGHGVLRLVGMWVCSGSQSESRPRSSTARASSTDADREVGREDGDPVAHRADSDAPSDPVHAWRAWLASATDVS